LTGIVAKRRVQPAGLPSGSPLVTVVVWGYRLQAAVPATDVQAFDRQGGRNRDRQLRRTSFLRTRRADQPGDGAGARSFLVYVTFE
jgi:hypothetical protein